MAEEKDIAKILNKLCDANLEVFIFYFFLISHYTKYVILVGDY